MGPPPLEMEWRRWAHLPVGLMAGNSHQAASVFSVKKEVRSSKVKVGRGERLKPCKRWMFKERITKNRRAKYFGKTAGPVEVIPACGIWGQREETRIKAHEGSGSGSWHWCLDSAAGPDLAQALEGDLEKTSWRCCKAWSFLRHGVRAGPCMPWTKNRTG